MAHTKKRLEFEVRALTNCFNRSHILIVDAALVSACVKNGNLGFREKSEITTFPIPVTPSVI